MNQGIVYTGVASGEELSNAPGTPSEERMRRGPVAVIECVQDIPCNPCEAACPFGAIQVGEPITNLPCLSEEKCTGCGACIPKCPGLAIFVIDMTYSETEAAVSFPYEYWPFPTVGMQVDAVNRFGQTIGKGTVVRIQNSAVSDHTRVVTLSVPKDIAAETRSMKRL